MTDKNMFAVELGKLNLGKKKKLSEKERKRRSEHMRNVANKRNKEVREAMKIIKNQGADNE